MNYSISEFSTSQVRDRDELDIALRLVHDNYVRSGYMEPQPSGMRMSIHHSLPQARCYVAKVADEVIATVSMFPDSELKLPLDAVYADCADALRASGRRIGEVGMLADRRSALSRGVHVLLRMMKQVFLAARGQHLDDLLITVNPKHAKFYQRLLSFEEIGDLRYYHAVGNAPAVLLRIRVSEVGPADAANHMIRDMFFSPLPHGEDAPGYSMRREDLGYFFMEQTDVFRHLTGREMAVIEEQYPGLDIASMTIPAMLPAARRLSAQ